MQETFVLGWEEWLELPELGLPAIKVKVDTGARTSALHAFSLEEIGSAERLRVRFAVHPIPGRDDVTVSCIADVVDRREVTSSNGETERRYVIRTLARMGQRTWPIEVTLTNRESMAYRMLLGRQAVQADMVVDPARSFLQPRLGYRVYGSPVRSEPMRQPLVIGLLSRRPDNASNKRLVRQAELRGHAMQIIDRRRVSLYIAAKDPAILVNGAPLERLDAIIFRSGKAPSAFSLAIVRQLEAMGSFALNPADALARVGDALVLRQTLALAGIPVPEVAVSPNDLARTGTGAEHKLADSLGALAAGPLLRFAICAGRALGAIERAPISALDEEAAWSRAQTEGKEFAAARDLAAQAAKVVGLGLATVDVVVSRAGPLVVGMTANVSISQFERLTGLALSEAVIIHIERSVAMRGSPSGRLSAD